MNHRLRPLLAIAIVAIVLVGPIDHSAASEPTGHPGMVGLTASWQSGQTDILFPIWASQKLVVTPSLSIAYASNYATDIGFALAVRVNQGLGRAVPYVGARVGAIHRAPDKGKGLTDYLVGGMLGGECFLQEKFSVGVEAQVNAVLSDKNSFRFGNPDGTNINTAAAVMATFYF